MFECLKDAIKGRDYIFKKELESYTGGVITQYTFTNLANKGVTNLPKSFVIGHKVAYKIDDVIQWLEENTELIGFEEEKPVKKSQLSVEELLLMKKRVKRRAQ